MEKSKTIEDPTALNIFAPRRDLDLTQAISLYDTAGYKELNVDQGTGERINTKDAALLKFRNVMEQSMTALTEATNKVLDKQTEVLEGALRSVQEAINDIDARMNYLSQQQEKTEAALDAFIKVFMLGGREGIDTSEQQEIMIAFLQRGLPVSPMDEIAEGKKTLTPEEALSQTGDRIDEAGRVYDQHGQVMYVGDNG